MRLHDHGVGIPPVLESLSSRASLPRMARAFRIKRQSCARTASRAASEAVAKSFYTFAFCTADLLRSCCSVIHPFPACHRNQNHVKWRHQTSEQNTLVAHCRQYNTLILYTFLLSLGIWLKKDTMLYTEIKAPFLFLSRFPMAVKKRCSRLWRFPLSAAGSPARQGDP